MLRRDWARANEVIRLKAVARASQQRDDIKIASKAAIRLWKHFATSNSVSRKEGEASGTIVDELRAIGAQLRLLNQMVCVQVCNTHTPLAYPVDYLHSGVNMSLVDHMDGPEPLHTPSDDIWEHSSDFRSIESDAFSDGVPPGSPLEWPPVDSPPYRKPLPKHSPKTRSTSTVSLASRPAAPTTPDNSQSSRPAASETQKRELKLHLNQHGILQDKYKPEATRLGQKKKMNIARSIQHFCFRTTFSLRILFSAEFLSRAEHH